ncbi:hypothetical protein [Streptomyces sp. NPDC008001]|uniref:hypothetical protein n=1 Tax=Streptomyces sp. NPDC008001 TaxID=3364804 RepID=UPI0036EBA0F7
MAAVEGRLMQWWQAALWGALGAALGELADFALILENKKKLPWKIKDGPEKAIYLLMVLTRVTLGIGAAGALTVFGQLAGGLGAFITGLSGPKTIDGLRKQARGSTKASEEAPPERSEA